MISIISLDSLVVVFDWQADKTIIKDKSVQVVLIMFFIKIIFCSMRKGQYFNSALCRRMLVASQDFPVVHLLPFRPPLPAIHVPVLARYFDKRQNNDNFCIIKNISR